MMATMRHIQSGVKWREKRSESVEWKFYKEGVAVDKKVRKSNIKPEI